MTMTPKNAVVPVSELGSVHVIGIGGAGMSGIARILVERGVTVSGSDAKDSRRLQALQAVGVTTHVGHDANHLGAADTVIFSTAIPESNPERQEAQRRGLRILNRAEALAAIMTGSRGVAVAGTHGKTTTTSMLTVALQHCGADPSFAIGSELNESGSNAHLGSGDIFVAEADESDGAFLFLPAIAGIVTNVEADHLNHWGTFEAVEQGFVDFVMGLGKNDAKNDTKNVGFAVVCADDPGARRLAEKTKDMNADVRTYGEAADADYRIVNAALEGRGWAFDISHEGSVIARIRVQVPGKHNALNATAAFVTGIGLGMPADVMAEGICGFTGTRRRFDFKGEARGIRVFDDYAHHPTEIEATLKAARDVAGEGNVVVAFQAHHYYRTAMFTKEFGEALGLADQVVVLEVFAPGETPIPGASGQTMAGNVPLPKEQVVFEPSWSAVAGHLVERAKPGDIIMTLGAGDIGMIGLEVLDLLRAERG